MANGTDTRSCVTTSWIVAAVAGLILFALLMLLGDWRFIQAAFGGVIAAVILGFFLTFFMCPEGSAKADLEEVRKGNKGAAAATAKAAEAAAEAKTTAAAEARSAGSVTASDAGSATADAAGSSARSSDASGAAAGASAAAASAAGAASTASKPFEMQPSKALAGEAELAERKGEWKYEGEAAPAKKAPAKKAPAKKAAASKPAAKSDSAAAKPKRAPVAADGKPETLKAARAGGADDLKLISGVGPKMEGMLNDMGFWHFDQVASWRKKEVQWVNDNLEGFKGRIERDDWVSQAKILAKGGETEFSKRKKK